MLLTILILLTSYVQPNWSGTIQATLTEGDASIPVVYEFAANSLNMQMTFDMEQGRSTLNMKLSQSSIELSSDNFNQTYSKADYKKLQTKPLAHVMYANNVGQEKTIQGLNCELLEIQTSLGKAIAWISTDIGDLTQYADFFHDDPIVQGLHSVGIKGFPIEYKIFNTDGSIKRSFQVTSISN